MKKTEKNYYQNLYEVASVLNSEREPKVLLQSFVKSVTKATGAKASSLMLLTPDRKVLLHTAAYGLSEWYLRKGPVKTGKVISAVLRGKTVAVQDAGTDERVLYREQAQKEGIGSILSVPMRLRGGVIGVVRVYTAKPRQFTKDEINFIEAISNIAAVALENVRAYDIIKKDYETFRQEMLQWRAELGDEWMGVEHVTPANELGPEIPPGG